jgi:hypothetical protein
MMMMMMVVASISGAAAQQQQQPCVVKDNILSAMGRAGNAALSTQHDFERAACEYRNCLAANASNINACEGLRHIMDASAQAAGHYSGSR